MERLFTLMPRFTETELFVASYIFALSLSVHAQKIFYFETYSNNVAPYVVLFLSLMFIFLSTYHAFSSRKKNMFEKIFLICMMLSLLIVAQIVLLMSREFGNMHYVLIVLNGMYVFWLILWLFNIAELNKSLIHKMIPDDDIKLSSIVPATAISFVAFMVMTYFLEISWGLVFASLIALSVPLTLTLEHFGIGAGHSLKKGQIVAFLVLTLIISSAVGLTLP